MLYDIYRPINSWSLCKLLYNVGIPLAIESIGSINAKQFFNLLVLGVGLLNSCLTNSSISTISSTCSSSKVCIFSIISFTISSNSSFPLPLFCTAFIVLLSLAILICPPLAKKTSAVLGFRFFQSLRDSSLLTNPVAMSTESYHH